jgi:hypothetical protein
MNHSFRDLFLQVAHGGTSALDWTPPQIAASLREVHIGDYKLPFLLTRLAFIAAFVLVLARHETSFAFGVGVLFIFVVLVTNMYYWQMLLLIALGCASRYRDDPHKLMYLLFLCVFLIAEYFFVHFGAPRRQGYFGSYWLGLLCVFVVLVETGYTEQGRRLLRRGCRVAKINDVGRENRPNGERWIK